MTKLLIKVAIYVSVVALGMAFINYSIDPAGLFHPGVVDDTVNALLDGKTVITESDMDEGYFKEKMISSGQFDPGTVIVGSSHIMFIDWEQIYPNSLNAGMSGSYLGEYYAVVGLLEANDITPERIVFGIDPWAFTRDSTTLRHTALNDYANYAKDVVSGKEVTYDDYGMSGTDIDKLKELFSFSYFQSSYKKIGNKGISYYFGSEAGKSHVIICENDEPDEELNKLTPQMRYIMATRTYETVQQMDANAEKQVDPPDVYQIGSEYKSLDMDNYNEFVELVDYLLSKGIEVSFYLPSFYPTVYDLIERDDSFRGIIEIEDETRKIASERGIEVHGAYNPYEAGVDKEDFANDLHMKPDVMLKNYLYTR